MKVFFILLSALLAILYPILIHLGITHVSPKHVAIILLVIVAARLAMLAKANRSHLKPYIPFFVIGVGSAALVYFSDNARLLLQIPTLVNTCLFIVFLRSYFYPPTIIEGFARADFPVMPDNAIQYCQRITLVWSASLLVCASICFYLAQYGPRSWWIAWASVGLYLYHGMVFGVEYVYRRTVKVPQFERAIEMMGATGPA